MENGIAHDCKAAAERRCSAHVKGVSVRIAMKIKDF
jgi:hypothetical protein